MDNLELVTKYWGTYFRDYLSCSDEELTIDDNTINKMILDLLENENLWNEIDSVIAEILIKHKAILNKGE